MARMLRCDDCPPGSLTYMPDTEAGAAEMEQHQREVHGAPAEPLPVTVKRWRCPFCRRLRASRARARDHIGRCWLNPAARACKTCAHFTAGHPGDYSEYGSDNECAAGVDIASELRYPVAPVADITPEMQRLKDETRARRDVYPGYELVAVPDPAWRLVSLRRCRAGQPSCKGPSVAEFRRGHMNDGRAWWAYCQRHLFGRWIEDGSVMQWVLRPVAADSVEAQIGEPGGASR